MRTNPDDLILIEEQDGVSVARLLSEALLDPMEIDQVEAALLRLIGRNKEPRLVIALDTVDHVSSLMISTLIKVRQEVAANHGEVCLAAVPPRLQGLFDVVKFGDVFDMYSTTKEAVRALQPEA